MTDSASSSSSPSESSLWAGAPSQWIHFNFYALCVLLAAIALGGIPFTGGLSAIGLVIPLGMWLWRWVVNRATRYELTSQRLRVFHGLLNRRLDELELYRVKDYVLEQPLFLRLLGLGNITLVTSDATTPTLVLRAISGAFDVREKLRTAVQTERDRKRVRALDVDDTSNLG